MLRINHIKKNISHVHEGKKHEMKFTDKEPSVVRSSRYVFVKPKVTEYMKVFGIIFVKFRIILCIAFRASFYYHNEGSTIYEGMILLVVICSSANFAIVFYSAMIK